MSEPTRKEVVALSESESWWEREPALIRGAVISVVGAAATILVVSGVLSIEQKQVLEENAGTIAVAVVTIIPIAQALWTRLKAFAPRTAAEIAVVNTDAAFKAGQAGDTKPVPVLIGPP